MAGDRRWDPSISHRGTEVEKFIADYFALAGRRILLVAGAGFDPRSTAVTGRLAATGSPIRALFVQENRPSPIRDLVDRATFNVCSLVSTLPNWLVIPVDIFATDDAVIGGRNVIRVIDSQELDEFTDVVIDISALSIGTSFPIVRYFVKRLESGGYPYNLHIFVAHDPVLDAKIRTIPSDRPGWIHGFKGGSTLDSSSDTNRLWLPQLATGRRGQLGPLFGLVKPHDTCPILPFPASNPRLGDELAEEFMEELESTWAVDARNIVYADEADPLDLYRTILRLDDLRKPVFCEAGGSLLFLSPLGSKIMALGALMAALERDLPVAHLEPIGYSLESGTQRTSSDPRLVHIWLEGDVYPSGRPALKA